MSDTEESARSQIVTFLPDAMKKALNSYNEFLDKPYTDEDKKSKEFKNHHDACKIAIAHIKLLIDLAERADISKSPDNNLGEDKQEQIRLMIENAQKEVSRYESPQK